ncbi:MAG: hypothetical protein LBR93_03705 [Treponema sp.]|jgi:hypothetical protein|nr:hypothetical protein [Treponema sp.]
MAKIDVRMPALRAGTVAALAVALVCGFVVLAGCASAPVDLTGVTSYYVRANGKDKNAGISEEKPFKTLAKAVEAASGSTVKTITVLGTLNSALPEITNTGAEIVITGKPDAAARDKAVLQIPKEGKAFNAGGDSRIRFEHITITGGELSGIQVNEGATVTLGQGAVVSGNSRRYGGGILVIKGGTLVMSGNALVTKNHADSGGGIFTVGTLLMKDDALVSENDVGMTDDGKDGQGGGVYAENAEVTLEGNAAVVKNSGFWGGGIYINPKSALVMRDSASIRENTIRFKAPKGGAHIGGSGGGVYLAGSLTMRAASAVSGNKAAYGGGILVGSTGGLVMEDRSVVKGNTAGTGTESDGTLFGGFGGGVSLAGTGKLTMRGESSLSGNEGLFGGGLRTDPDSQAVLEGKASIKNNSATQNNEKKYGGNGGGGVIQGTFTLRDAAQVSGNTARYSGGIDLYGKLILEGNAKVTGNTATVDGGGVYINKGGSVTGDSSLIGGNKADEGADIFTKTED